MLKKLAIASLCALSAAAFITGCGSSQKPASSAAASAPAEKKEITVGATAGPHAEVVEAAAKEAEKNGLKVNVKEFSDYITPDQALADGDLDIVVYQHKPFMENFNKQHGTHLTDIGRAILMRMGIYSNKVKDVKDLPDGATISIPNDPTNEGRGLQLLEKAGVIKLKEGVGMKATPADVVENPKNIQFKEIEAAQLPRSLDDVDASVITMNYVMSAGLSPEKQGIFLEDKDTPLAVMIIAVREKDKDQPAYKKFVQAYQSDAVKKFIAEKIQRHHRSCLGLIVCLNKKLWKSFLFQSFFIGTNQKSRMSKAHTVTYTLSPPDLLRQESHSFMAFPVGVDTIAVPFLFRRKGFCKIKDR